MIGKNGCVTRLRMLASTAVAVAIGLGATACAAEQLAAYDPTSLDFICSLETDGHALIEATFTPVTDEPSLMSVRLDGDATLEAIGVLPAGSGFRTGDQPPTDDDLSAILGAAPHDSLIFSVMQPGLRAVPETGSFELLMRVQWPGPDAAATNMRIHWVRGEPGYYQDIPIELAYSDCS
jgi:hypothetical protein